MNLNLVVFIVGPTASGKSRVALSVAKNIRGEIISADSMQVYVGMNIGTAKPTKRDLRQVPHHLIDIVKPSQTFSAHKFRQAALKEIKRIHKRGRIPIVVGGSGLYVRALLEGFSTKPGANLSFRKDLKEKISRYGLKRYYNQLIKRDPNQIDRVAPTDEKRIIRALEIIRFSKFKSSHTSQKQVTLESLGYKVLLFGLSCDRNQLYEQINNRVDHMMKIGFRREVEKLSKGRMSRTAKLAVGYRELLNQAALNSEPMETVIDTIKRNSRRYAKRQMTWFRREKGLKWLYYKNSPYEVKETILSEIKGITASD